MKQTPVEVPLLDSIKFDLNNLLFYYNSREFPLDIVWNDCLVKAEEEGRIFLTEAISQERNPLYFCTRKFLNKSVGKDIYYMDILAYNSPYHVLGKETLNRSLGHVNDVKEIEIHQVLKGKVLELIEYNNQLYFGIFKAGDYFEVPEKSFHCTYVLMEDTIVANIYSHIYWEDDFSKKPYFTKKNKISVCRKDGECAIESEEGHYIAIGEELDCLHNFGYQKYDELDRKALPITRNYNLDNNIFQLFELLNEVSCIE